MRCAMCGITWSSRARAVPITGHPKFVGVRDAALMLVRDHHARRVCAWGGTHLIGLVVADTNDPSVLAEVQVPDPAADMAAQIDPAFLHTRDRSVIGGTACQLLTQTGTFDYEGGTKVQLKNRLHHRAAADVANTDTENPLHHPTKAQPATDLNLLAAGLNTGRADGRR